MRNIDQDPLVNGIKMSPQSAIMLMEDWVAAHRRRAAFAFVVGLMIVIAASFMPGMFAEVLGPQFDASTVREASLGLMFVMALFQFTFFVFFLWMAQQQQRKLTMTIQNLNKLKY